MSRSAMIAGLILAGFLAVGMFRAKDGASESAQEIAQLRSEIKALKEEIRLLETEFEVVTRREDVARLASQYLGMRPARASQLIDERDVVAKLGPLEEHEGAAQ